MIVLVGERYAVQRTSTGTPATVTFSPTGTVSAGNTLVLLVSGGASGAYTVSVADSKSNTWTVDVNVATSGRTADVAHAYITTPILATDTITITVNYSGSAVNIWAEEFSGLVSGNSLDRTATKTVSISTSYTTSSTGTLSQADELAIGTAFIADTGIPGYTKDANFTDTPTQQLYRSASQYWIVNSTNAITMSASWTNSINNVAALATFKAETVGPGVIII